MTERETPWLSESEMKVWRRWLRVQTELPVALSRALHQDSELSLQDFETLVRLSEAPDNRLRISALADQMHWERSRLSHHLKRMAVRGLVVREECSEDGRGAFIGLTDVGRQSLADAAPTHMVSVREYFLDEADDEELSVLNRFLDRVLERTETEQH